jgi:hypothetical protein
MKKFSVLLLFTLFILAFSSCKEDQQEDVYIYQNDVLAYFTNEAGDPIFTDLNKSSPIQFRSFFYDDLSEPERFECSNIVNYTIGPVRNPTYNNETQFFLYFNDIPDTMNVKFIYDSEIDFYFQEITFQGVTYFEKYELLPERIGNDTLECGVGIIYHEEVQ